MLRPLKLGRSPYTSAVQCWGRGSPLTRSCMLIEIYVRFSPSRSLSFLSVRPKSLRSYTAAPVERRRCVVLLRPSTSARRLSGYSTPMAAAAVWRGSLDSELLLLLSSLPGQTRGNGNRFSRLGRKKSSILLSAGACCCSSQVSQCVRLLPSLGFWDYRRRIASNRFIVVCSSTEKAVL